MCICLCACVTCFLLRTITNNNIVILIVYMKYQNIIIIMQIGGNRAISLHEATLITAIPLHEATLTVQRAISLHKATLTVQRELPKYLCTSDTMCHFPFPLQFHTLYTLILGGQRSGICLCACVTCFLLQTITNNNIVILKYSYCLYEVWSIKISKYNNYANWGKHIGGGGKHAISELSHFMKPH